MRKKHGNQIIFRSSEVGFNIVLEATMITHVRVIETTE